MGTSQNNHKHMPPDQHKILKEAGKLTGALDKPYSEYKAVDEHEMSLVFDKHLSDQTSRENQNVPEVDIDEPPEQESPDKADAPEVAVKVSFDGKKGKRK